MVYCVSVSVECSASDCTRRIICSRPQGEEQKKGTPGEGAAAICNRAAWARSRKRFHVRRTETRVMVPIFEAWTLFTSPYVRYLSNVLGDYSVMTRDSSQLSSQSLYTNEVTMYVGVARSGVVSSCVTVKLS